MVFEAPFNKCPFCSSNEGFFTREQIHGAIRFRYNFDGSEKDNSNVYNDVNFTGGRAAYCISCNRLIFRFDD